MLRKKLGTEAIERDWHCSRLINYFKIQSPLVISEGCEKIGTWAFWCCDNLKEVVIPKSVKRIEDYAFCSCRQATIILKKHKKDFKYIGISAFKGCKDVKKEVRS